MRTTTTFWAVAGLVGAAAAVPAQASSETPATTTTTSGPAPTCTATLISTLCDYPPPGPEFALASEGKESCWQTCQAHSPCNFVIFAAGNPYTGTGSCWLYPGQTFAASKGQDGSTCAHPPLYVYDKPTCTGGGPGPGDGVPSQCSAAVATPSALAEVCEYPTLPNNCFDGCTASNGASDCLAQCAKADACSFVVFNPSNPSKSPYSTGSCWMYPDGAYDAKAGKTCSGATEQYVYNNTCPRPSPTTSKAPSSATGTGSPNSAKMDSSAAAASTTTSKNVAPTALVLSHGLVVGAAALAWHAL